MKSNGQIAYESQRELMVLPEIPWGSCSDAYRQAWEKVAQAVLDAQECVHPWTYMGGVWSTEPLKCYKCGKEL